MVSLAVMESASKSAKMASLAQMGSVSSAVQCAKHVQRPQIDVTLVMMKGLIFPSISFLKLNESVHQFVHLGLLRKLESVKNVVTGAIHAKRQQTRAQVASTIKVPKKICTCMQARILAKNPAQVSHRSTFRCIFANQSKSGLCVHGP